MMNQNKNTFWVFCIATLLLFSSTPSDGQITKKSEIIGQDFIQCIEKGGCGIESICAFKFKKYHIKQSNDPNGGEGAKDENDPCDENKVPSSQTVPKANEDQGIKGLCEPMAEGYILSITNQMDYPVKFNWNVLDKIIGLSKIHRDNGTLVVPSKSVRYFTDSLFTTHTVRLFVNNEFVDEVLALEQKKCNFDDTCDLLFRLCYQPKEDRYNPELKAFLNESNEMDNNMFDPICNLYEKECSGFSKRKTDREKDLQTFLSTYFPSLLKESGITSLNSKNGKIKENIKAEDVMECIINSPGYKKFKSSNGNFISTKDSLDEHSDAGFITAIVLLSLLILILIIMVICWVPYCTTSYWSNRFYSQKKNDDDQTMQNQINLTKSLNEQISNSKLQQQHQQNPKKNLQKFGNNPVRLFTES